jgi:dTDP-4-amino-4,6-dideoxygalactose transaminase
MRLPSDADSSGRSFGPEELALLREVIESGTLNSTRGKQVRQFEQEFAERYGAPHCCAVSSGTAAVHAAIAALDPEPGDEIITSPITDMGAITPILYQQAIPVFADVDPDTLNVTPETVARCISGRTRAIIVTHLFGNPCDVPGIIDVASKHGIAVIEDCAQAYLATWCGRLVGTFGAMGVSSLQQGKHMTAGEGGMVITADAALARRIRLFRDKAWGYDDPAPDHYFLALNYRMTELQGAVARAQLRKLDGMVESRRQAAARLTELTADLPGLQPPSIAPQAAHSFWRYCYSVDAGVIAGGADALGTALAAEGIRCQPRYIKKLAFECEVIARRRTFGSSGLPLSLQSDGATARYERSLFPGASAGLERILVLPWTEKYTEEHVAFIASVIQKAVLKLEVH